MRLGLDGLRPKSAVAVTCLALFALTGCDNKSAPPPEAPAPAKAVEDSAIAPATLDAWLHGVGILDTSLAEAQSLAQAIQKLLDSPDDANLEGARLAWYRGHDAYIEFELYTALSGGNPGLFGSLLEYDFAIEAWPIQPGYLDYYDVYTHSGIVNDIAMPVTADALRQQHGFTDPSDVSLGFHSLEYLLWGENGERPASDYRKATLGSGQESAGVRTVDLPSNRRRALISLLANLLIDDIEAFKQAMEDPEGPLRRNYLALQPHSRLALLQNAGHALLSHHRDLLQAQLEHRSEGDEAPADEALESIEHSPFAGGAPGNLAHSLRSVEQVLLDDEDGLGNWLIEDQQERAAKREQLAQLRTELLSWHDQTWPPDGDKGQAVVDTLAELAATFEPESFSSSNR